MQLHMLLLQHFAALVLTSGCPAAQRWDSHVVRRGKPTKEGVEEYEDPASFRCTVQIFNDIHSAAST